MSFSSLLFDVDAFKEMRALKGVILKVTHGKDKGDVIDKAVYTLSKQDVHISGVLMKKDKKI